MREAEVLEAVLEEIARSLGTAEHDVDSLKEYGGLRLEQTKRFKELEKENIRLKRLVADLSLDNAILKDTSLGKLVSPTRRREAVANTIECYGVSERRACRVLGQCRATQRYVVRKGEDEERLRHSVITLSKSMDVMVINGSRLC